MASMILSFYLMVALPPVSRERPDALCEPLIGVEAFLQEKFPKPFTWDDETIKKVVIEAHSKVDPFDLVAIEDEKNPDLNLYRKAIESGDCSHFGKIWDQASVEVPKALKARLQDVQIPLNADEAYKAYKAERGEPKEDDPIDFVGIYLNLSAVFQRQFESHSIKVTPEYIHRRALESINDAIRPYEDDEERDSARRAFVVDSFIQVLDPMNDFLTKSELERIKKSTSNYQGLGIQVFEAPNGLFVADLLAGGMAQREGILKKGDVIVEAPVGETTKGLPINNVVKKLMGPANTRLKVKVQRGEEVIELEVSRGFIVASKIRCEMNWSKGIDYCQLPSFYGRENGINGAADDLADFISDSPNRSLVLDLRSNPGGSLDEAIKISSMVFAKTLKEVLEARASALQDKLNSGAFETEDQARQALAEMIPYAVILESREKVDGLPFKFPRSFKVSMAPNQVVVLVNNGSASASEVVACNVKASAAGIVVSDGSSKTSGKASFQSFQEGSLGGILKYTGGYYHTMDGFSPHAIGCKPDVIIPALETPRNRSMPGSFNVKSLEGPFLIDRSSTTQSLLTGSLKAVVGEVTSPFGTYEKAEEQFLDRVKKLAEELSKN